MRRRLILRDGRRSVIIIMCVWSIEIGPEISLFIYLTVIWGAYSETMGVDIAGMGLFTLQF